MVVLGWLEVVDEDVEIVDVGDVVDEFVGYLVFGCLFVGCLLWCGLGLDL